MPDRLLHRTWSIRTIGPFARALCVGGPRPTSGSGAGGGALPAQTMASTCSAQAGPGHNEEETEGRTEGEGEGECRWFPTLSELAEQMTHRLRSACPGPALGPAGSSGSGSGSGGAVSDHNGGGGGGLLEIGGTYAALTWIDLVADDDDEDGGGEGQARRSGDAGRKRTRGASRRRRRRRHLHVDVMIGDEPAAQLLLVGAQAEPEEERVAASASSSSASSAPAAASAYFSGEEPIRVSSFAYLLVRGKSRALYPILAYLESTLGCVVGTRPFEPGPADVAASLSDWMVGTIVVERRRQKQRQGQGRTSIGSGSGSGIGGGVDNDMGAIGGMAAAAATTKPLELTLAVPPHLVQAGLERITVTVPPVSLARLCAAVERKRPRPLSSAAGGGTGTGSCASGKNGGGTGNSSKASRSGRAITPLMVTDSEKDDESSGYRAGVGAVAAAAGSAAAASVSVSASGAKDAIDAADRQQQNSPNDGRADEEDEEEKVPILRALQCYLYEAFHIDARQLHVVKAATAHAVVGTDGRIKPLTVEALPSLLEDIGMMIRRSIGGASSSKSADIESLSST